MEVLIDLPESNFARLRGAAKPKVYATFATAPGKRYPLTVKEFSTQADPRTQAYQVTLLMPQPREINVLPGMTANVIGTTLLGESMSNRILIPAIAVVSDESGQAHVWVYDSDTTTVDQRKVTVGDLTGTKDIQILDGLNPGDTIAVTGVGQLREGMKVRPLDN